MCPLCGACGGLNWLAVLVATGAAFMLGGLWYSPVMFLKPWMKALGKNPEEHKNQKGLGKAMALCFIITFVTAFALAEIFLKLGVHTAEGGALVALFICAGFVVASHFNDFLFTGWNTGVFWIGAGYKIVEYVTMGAILGAWHR